MIVFTRAAAVSPDGIAVSATRENAEIYAPDARVFQYDHGGTTGRKWFYDDFALSVQDIRLFDDQSATPAQPHEVLLSAEGDIYHFAKPEPYQERIAGAGTTEADSKFYGKVLALRQIGTRLYACGAGGQVYVRHGRDDWRMLTDALLLDPEAERRRDADEAAQGFVEPEFGSQAWQDWVVKRALAPVSRNILFYGMAGLSEDAIYLCGVTGPGSTPVLCYWDGTTLEELKLPVAEAALTGLYIENPDSVWVCGREGTLLHGSRGRGFNPVPGDRRLNLFHSIAPYRGKLVMPASVRPGGLWEFDPATGAFGHFEPRLPPLTRPPSDSGEPHGGPFFAEATGDVLWVVAPRDIYRFDGSEWERIKHPDLP